MVLLESIPPSPRISKVGIRRDSPCEPVTSFVDLAFSPEETSDGDDDFDCVVRLLERIDGSRLASWTRLRPDGVRVERS